MLTIGGFIPQPTVLKTSAIPRLMHNCLCWFSYEVSFAPVAELIMSLMNSLFVM